MRRAHADLLEQGAAPAGVRDVVADSWLRSVAAGVDVDASQPPITLDRGPAGDVELALDAAHGAGHSWGRTPAAERAGILNKIADRIEANLEMLDHYQQTKNLLVSYSPKALGFF